jgi:alkylhydroperoxidase family enzyme
MSTAWRDRLPGLAEQEWSPEVADLLWSTVGPVRQLEGADPDQRPSEPDHRPSEQLAGRPLPILPVIAHQARFLGPFLAWASAVALDGVLSRRQSELLALRTAHNCRSDFEWSHHAVFAKAVGVTDDELSRVADGPGAAGWDGEEADLLWAADELHRSSTITDGTWARLAERHAPAALVEIVLVVGQYTMLSMLANAAGVPIDDVL